MTTTSKLTVDEGTTTPLATYEIAEDAENKQLSRTVLNDGDGNEITALPVSAASLPLPTGAATAANQQTDALTDTELRASAVPVSAAALPLPTGAATAANQQTDALTDTELRAVPVPVSGTVAVTGTQTDALTDTQLRASAVPVSATNLDIRDLTFAADKVDASGTVLGAGTNNIGDVDVLSLPALPAGTNTIGTVRQIGVSGRIIDSDDLTTVITVKVANGVATASGDNVVLAAVTGKKIRVLSYGLQVQEAGTVTARFQDNGTATNRTMPWFLVAGATQYDGVVRNPGGPHHFYFETDAGVGLDLNLSGATDTGWEVTYCEVD